MLSSTGCAATFSSPPDRVGREGALRLRVERRGGASVVASCRSTVPLQVLAPVGLDDPAAVVSILNPTGGVVGGDRLGIDVAVGPGAHACLTTPSATRVYRTSGPPAVQEVSIDLGPGATLEYVPDHTIPFPGSAFRQAIRVHVGDGAQLILVDAFAAGRITRGEAWRFALLESALVIRDADGWLLRDRFVLAGDPAWGGLGFAEAAAYFATIVVLGERANADLAAELTRATDGAGVAVAGGALPRGGGIILRCLAATAPLLGETTERLWAAARRLVLGVPPLLLRKA
jgi:urease accessory protein